MITWRFSCLSMPYTWFPIPAFAFIVVVFAHRLLMTIRLKLNPTSPIYFTSILGPQNKKENFLEILSSIENNLFDQPEHHESSPEVCNLKRVLCDKAAWRGHVKSHSAISHDWKNQRSFASQYKKVTSIVGIQDKRCLEENLMPRGKSNFPSPPNNIIK